ncbi:TerB family tellurite resistance protein [Vreelandella rituensis]|uniref:TerB family tellurite resistance protein n=1 Tax=Vreelandella rituensis TaxID=2282306 RepID=A0A368TYE7_9GAMM|nr:TerB family tellurite resistance protein [Halomonas rituensis]RCV89611.1 TerB family tellurite resistance protein [Halomonas rituensis]
MLDAIQQFFQRSLVEPESRQGDAYTLELASAALLCEVMRADHQVSEAELSTLRHLLRERYHLGGTAVDELMELARQEVEDAVDHYQFVSLIKEHYGYEQRVELVRLMWQLAWADGKVDPLEEHRIRRLADLLHVGHSDFIRTKLSVEEERQST